MSTEFPPSLSELSMQDPKSDKQSLNSETRFLVLLRSGLGVMARISPARDPFGGVLFIKDKLCLLTNSLFSSWTKVPPEAMQADGVLSDVADKEEGGQEGVVGGVEQATVTAGVWCLKRRS